MSGALSDRSRVRRRPHRAHYDRETLYGILDAGLLCHVGYVRDGTPVVTPTLYWREGDAIYWHGSSASRMLDSNDGADVCLTVSFIDGLVLARCAFNHSMNYRSAMLFGRARSIEDDTAKLASLKSMMDSIYPGRWQELRPVTGSELKATRILWMAIDEASAKIRTGGPIDGPDDMKQPVWAGVIPLNEVLGEILPEMDLPEDRRAPAISGRLPASR